MKSLIAEATVELADPEHVVRQVCDHIAEHGATIVAHDGEIAFSLGLHRGVLRRVDSGLHIRAEAPDLSGLDEVRAVIASHLIEFAGEPAPRIRWNGDGAGVRPPLNFREVRVVEARTLTPHMRRIVFSAQDLARFDGLLHLHVKLLLPPSRGSSTPQWPMLGEDGLMRWEGGARPAVRRYTLREIDVAAGRFSIDFVLHADAGVGSGWATDARPGDVIGMIGPGGRGLLPAQWYLFAGDETALPAIARMLEALADGVPAIALIEVADATEEQAIATKASARIRWLHRNGAAPGTTSLLADAIREVTFPTDGSSVYVWVAGEFDAFRSIRTFLRKERGLKKHEHLAVSYWRRGRSDDEAEDAEA